MACEMLGKVETSGGKVDTLIMDNDSTTIARVKAQINPNISKRSDSNHTKKGFTGALVELSSAHKVLRNVKGGTWNDASCTVFSRIRTTLLSLRLILEILFHTYMESISLVVNGAIVKKQVTNPNTCHMVNLCRVLFSVLL